MQPARAGGLYVRRQPLVTVIDKRTTSRLLWLSIGGFVPPLFFMVVGLLDIDAAERLRDISIYLWPTQLQMMAASGHPETHPWFWGVFAISTAFNVLLYVTVGFMFCWLFVDLLWGKVFKKAFTT